MCLNNLERPILLFDFVSAALRLQVIYAVVLPRSAAAPVEDDDAVSIGYQFETSENQDSDDDIF